MEKKIRFSEQPLTSKIIYGVVIAILIFSAVIVGIVAANNRKNNTNTTEPPITDDGTSGGENNTVSPDENQTEDENKDDGPLTFTMPMAGEIITSHSLTVPVFSETLGEWRIHTGIDIACEEGAEVYCAANGKVTKIYNDPLHGMTVEVSHEGDITSIYSNLDETIANGIEVDKEIKAGDKIGTVGDTSLVELGKEPHLHFVIRLKGVAVNPLDYFEKENDSAVA